MKRWIVWTFLLLYAWTSTVSAVHSVEFFEMTNPKWLAVSLAGAFEIGAAACLAGIVVLEKTSAWMIWSLFAIVTATQVMANVHYAFAHAHDFANWAMAFGMQDLEPMMQRRILSWSSGGILPIVALGFIKSLVDYLRGARAEKEEEDPIGIIQDLQDAESDVPARETQDQLHASGRHRKKPWWDA